MKRKALKMFRISHDLTQQETADKLGYSLSQYALIEQGRRNATLAFWSKFQQVFDVPDAEMWQLMKGGQK